MLRRMSRTLPEVLALLERLAPLNLAEEWDNVGLLLEPSAAAQRPIARAFLCIDLSESVLDEALGAGADFLIAYHPPLFRGLKRLRASTAEDRVLLRALEAGLAVYSPHTALDAAVGGVNDWLASAFGPGRCTPLVAPQAAPNAEFGAGRLLQLDTPISVMDAVARLKAHLGVATLRVATSGTHAAGTPIARIAVCAGAGGSLFEKVRAADLFVTGEMRHHDVLTKIRQGSSVLLSEHTHTERGFLPSFARRLEAAAEGQLQVLVSQVDADPLRTL
jgi:dinuclear metal center YbgI/SA1388 family protein